MLTLSVSVAVLVTALRYVIGAALTGVLFGIWTYIHYPDIPRHVRGWRGDVVNIIFFSLLFFCIRTIM